MGALHLSKSGTAAPGRGFACGPGPLPHGARVRDQPLRGAGLDQNPDGGGAPNSEILDQTQKQILAELKKLYPAGTKFANYWISVSGIRSDTGYVRYATIPVGIIERNWKEH